MYAVTVCCSQHDLNPCRDQPEEEKNMATEGRGHKRSVFGFLFLVDFVKELSCSSFLWIPMVVSLQHTNIFSFDDGPLGIERSGMKYEGCKQKYLCEIFNVLLCI